MESKTIICWWSGGATSAVACKLAVDIFGLDSCEFLMIDTKNEDDDTYRFKKDCEKWYGKKINTISAIPERFESIQDVWRKYKSLNIAQGAVCSLHLKMKVRERWQKNNDYKHQVFGYDFQKKEMNRALSIKLNHPTTKAIFPLLMYGYTKSKCMEILEDAGIAIPNSYKYGFQNNNCIKTGCVQGGVGYWQKMKREHPDKFIKMANIEHELTNEKGKPVTMLKDQSAQAKKSGIEKVFLIKHPKYPNHKSIDDMPKCKVEAIFECNGFCGTDDLNERTTAEKQLNFDFE